MDEIEVSKLLGLMALADNRKPPEDDEGRRVMIGFWLGMVGDLSYADAVVAVREHYQDSREWIMPADIRRRVKAARNARLMRTPLPAPDPDLADQPGPYLAAVLDGVRRIADGFDAGKAIGGPLPGEPPAAWTEARASMQPTEQPTADPQQIALRQVEASRAEREACEDVLGEAS